MYTINKAKETMTSKERVRRTFALDVPDRVPIDYEYNITVHRKLKEALGLKADSPDDDLKELLGVDFRGINVSYVGKPLFPEIPGLIVGPEYGFYTRWIENEYGGYSDYCHFPLKGAESEQIAAHPVPNPDDYNYEIIPELVKKYKDKAIYVGNAGISDIINTLGFIMGMEDALVNLQLEDEGTLEYLEKKTNFELGKMERTLDAIKKAGGEADFMWLGEDLGTQIAPMVGMPLFRNIIKPIKKRFVELADAYNIPTMIHTCGSSSWAYEDFIEIGIKAVDTLQPEARNMAPAYLAEKFGGRLSFHGCISTVALADLTADGVDAYCKKTLDIMMPVRGYHFSPTHQIQDNTPIENIVAMYNAAHKYGVY